MKPKLLKEALSHTVMFLKYALQSERDLVGSREFLAQMKGISSQAVEEAKKTIGLYKSCFRSCYHFRKTLSAIDKIIWGISAEHDCQRKS